MKKIILASVIPFIFTGCCISFFDDSCVIVEEKITYRTEYLPCKVPYVPKKPKNQKVNFVQMEMNGDTYYVLDEQEAYKLSDNWISYDSYCSETHIILESVGDTNVTK